MKATAAVFCLLVPFGLFLSPGVAQAQIPDSAAASQAPDRRPVLLIPGWMSRAVDLFALKERLVRDGWPPEEVYTIEFDDPVGSSVDHARELDEALQAFMVRTGAEEVDLVAHSMGGLAVWVLLQEKDGFLPLRRVVFLATPFQGTVTAHLAWGEGGPEMKPGSEFLSRLWGGRRPQDWVEALTVRTPLDVTVMPGQGATVMGITDRVVCCPTHQGLLDHEEAYRVTKEFLLHGRSLQRDRGRFLPIWREWMKGVGG